MCVWLSVPTFDACGGDDDRWDYGRINDKIIQEINGKATLVLPLTTVIETGNHIAQRSGDRYGYAKKLCDLLVKCVDNESPWATFFEQKELFDGENTKKFADKWPALAAQELSIGDAIIIEVAEYYAKSGCNVEIFTGDSGLKSYEPAKPALQPRRRR